MNVATGEKMQAEGSQPPAVAAEPAEAQADDQTAQADDQEAPQPALAPAAKESKRPRGRPPGPRKAGIPLLISAKSLLYAVAQRRNAHIKL